MRLENNNSKTIETAANLIKVSSDYFKPLTDALSKVFKEEPHLKLMLLLFKTPTTVSDAIFMHKFRDFYEASGLNEESLKELDKKLSGKKKSRFWKLIFTSVQSHDDEKRSVLVGKVIKAYSVGKITYDETIRMIHASNTVNVENLKYLQQCYMGNPRTMPGYARQEFVIVGLLGMDQSSIGTWSGAGGATYPLVDFGARYVGAIYDYPAYPNRKDIRVGEEHLVNAGKDTSISNRAALPYKQVVDEKLWYGEAALVLRDKDKIWLVKNNPVVASSPIYAGEYGEKALSNITNIKEEHFTPVRIRSDIERHVSIHYYTLDTELANDDLKKSSGSWVNFKPLVSEGRTEELRQLADGIVKFDEAFKQKASKSLTN